MENINNSRGLTREEAIEKYHVSGEALSKLHQDPITGEWKIGVIAGDEREELYKENDNTELYQSH